MALDLFACIAVSDYPAALEWYERLLGTPPTYVASDTEAVWELAEHRSLAVEHRPEHAGHALTTVFVDDLDSLVAGIAARGVAPANRETYANGVRKVTYRDPDGNEIGFGGAPL
ncbi:VOC family protein [Streptomonospora nanhaiensis]|uniref:Catechol 2,3-dioxygenase-like lactoylglutathione lyase family enzyme n=1 Tax=Streptomonospora nanhaiensis TaxID=1323731 RepID=A0A853BPA3_9ACTN|nr:VOC family protein [Streptomonospora nanhaiensis]MBV2364001.1 VOC family protein [Streptomonospora nanhaiensis]MBX9387345.1 VOC family protein [Streptomonospora nanhaiensis]NYI97003.1 catechol 2,3-dioxygenase-like lactoylglutathione lyase family enzyme [Streptomonospora nanhaiensis]